MTKPSVLLVNNLFTPQNGGAIVVYNLYHELNKRGVRAEVFACDRKPYFDPDYPYQNFFPPALELDEMSTRQKLAGFVDPMYNQEAYRRLKRFLAVFTPDLVHFHGIQRYLSPSVIRAVIEARVPMVMTLHDSFFICPATTLMRGEKEYCSDYLCVTEGAWACVKHRCMRGSLFRSVYNAAEFKLRQIHKLYDRIGTLITPSEAYRQLLVRLGTEPERLVTIYNCIERHYYDNPAPREPGQYFLYVGRLVKEKGLDTLIKAMARCPELTLKIVGTGPQREELETLIRDLTPGNVELCGFLRGAELNSAYRNCLATILPCNWLETFGLTVVESFAFGKPVIASDLGALQELIDDGETGLLVPPADEQALVTAMRRLAATPARTHAMGLTAKRMVEGRFGVETFVDAHLRLYRRVAPGAAVSWQEAEYGPEHPRVDDRAPLYAEP